MNDDPLAHDMMKLVRAYYLLNPPARRNVYAVLDALAATAAAVLAGAHPEWQRPAEYFELSVAKHFNDLLELMREQDGEQKMQ